MNNADETIAVSLHNDILRHLDREHGKLALRTNRYRQFLMLCKAIMYVCLGIAALTYASSANARELSYMPNKAGGEIVLTDSKSETCHDGTFIAVSRTREGDTLIGCWAISMPYVYVQWADGALSMFKLSDFTAFTQKNRGLES